MNVWLIFFSGTVYEWNIFKRCYIIITQLSNKAETWHLNSAQAYIFKKATSVKCRIRMPFWHFFMFPRLDYDGNWNGSQDMTAEGGFLYYSRLQGCPKVTGIAQSLHNDTCCYFVTEGTVTF